VQEKRIQSKGAGVTDLLREALGEVRPNVVLSLGTIVHGRVGHLTSSPSTNSHFFFFISSE
jgi:hypothetical protein